ARAADGGARTDRGARWSGRLLHTAAADHGRYARRRRPALARGAPAGPRRCGGRAAVARDGDEPGRRRGRRGREGPDPLAAGRPVGRVAGNREGVPRDRAGIQRARGCAGADRRGRRAGDRQRAAGGRHGRAGGAVMPDPGPALHSSPAELAEAAEVRTEDLSLARAWLRRFGGPFLDLLADALPFERETLTLAVIAGMLSGGARFLWLSRQAVYFDLRRRRVVLPTEVRQELDKALDRAGQQARQDTLRIVQPGGSLADWELTMRRAVKDSQISATVLAEGGVRRVSVGGLIEVRDEIHSQFGF